MSGNDPSELGPLGDFIPEPSGSSGGPDGQEYGGPADHPGHPYLRLAAEKGITLWGSMGTWQGSCWMGESHTLKVIPGDGRWFCVWCGKAGRTAESFRSFLETWPDQPPVRKPPPPVPPTAAGGTGNRRRGKRASAETERPEVFFGSLQDGPDIDVLKVAGLGDLWEIAHAFPAVYSIPSGHALLNDLVWVDCEVVGEDEKGPGMSDTYYKYTVRNWTKLIAEVRDRVKEALGVDTWPEDLELGSLDE
jgi:hypothetical protein